jgi:hypothetical protein
VLQPGRDYQIDSAGRLVFTAQFLRSRGYCCFQGCRNCPWGQAGKGPEHAAAELAERLNTLQDRLHRASLSLHLRDCRDGVLRLAEPLPEAVSKPDGEALRARWSAEVQHLAKDLLHLRAVAWPGYGIVTLDPFQTG